MKLIFIYGVPGVGKLTVAKELSKLSGFKVFHSHLTVDLVESIFDFGSRDYVNAVHTYRLDLIERAARSKIKGLICTFFYVKPQDDAFVKSVVRRVERHNGKVLFAHLVCDRSELFKRVKHPGRKLFHKIKTHKKLHRIMRGRDMSSDVPYRENITIDNTRISPKRAAKLIQRHYRL